MPLCRETDGERQTKRQKRTGTVGYKETSWVYSWGHYQHLFLFNQLSNTNPPFYSVSLTRTQISYYCHPESHKLLLLPFCLLHAPTAAILRPTSLSFCNSEGLQLLKPSWEQQSPVPTILRSISSCFYHRQADNLLLLPFWEPQTPTPSCWASHTRISTTLNPTIFHLEPCNILLLPFRDPQAPISPTSRPTRSYSLNPEV